MNDAEALAEINRILQLWFKAELDGTDALFRISRVTGMNKLHRAGIKVSE